MRLKFRSRLSDNLAFHHAYQREFAAKAVPKWFQRLLGFVLLGGFGAIGYLLFPQPDRLMALYVCLGLFCWLCYVGYSYGYRIFAARYLHESDDSDLCFVEVAEGRFASENRGIWMSFPLDALSTVFERDDYVYLYFGRLGAGRVPFEAFESTEQRGLFIALAKSHQKEPNQSLEPTPTSVTPRAEPRVAPDAGVAHL